MTRVWLREWEWACCGDPFVVGDDVVLSIDALSTSGEMEERLGGFLSGTIDAVESHHDGEFDGEVRGRVVAVHAVTQEFVEHRSLRRPGHGVPASASMPTDGEDWPASVVELANGFSMVSPRSRYITELLPLPGTLLLEPVFGVRQAPAAGNVRVPPNDPDIPSPPVSSRSVVGWLVDVTEEPNRDVTRGARSA